MNKFKILGATLLLAGMAFAQTSAPSDLIGVRVGYDASTDPTTSGGFIYAHKIAGDTKATYSYTQINFLPQKMQPYVHMTTTETGIAQQVATIGPFAVFALGTAGGAFAGDNVGLAFSGGGIAMAGLGHGIYAGPYARASKTSISNGQYEYGLSLFIAFKK
jgi:hypothetical protein